MKPTDDSVRERVDAWRTMMQYAFKRRRQEVLALNGNFLVFVPGMATMVVRTAGPNPGLHFEAGDERLHFALYCEPSAVTAFLDGDKNACAAHVAAGRIRMEGAIELYARFMLLATEATRDAIAAQPFTATA